MKRRLVALVLIALAWQANGEVTTQTGMPMSGAEKLTLEKCGEAKLSVLFWDVYQSSLYTPDGSYQPGVRPLRLEIQYLRNIGADDLVNQTRKEWEAQGLNHPDQEDWLAMLLELWPDVQADDVIALSIDEAEVSQFSFNGELLGEIADPASGEQFAAIWLSPDTTRPSLRKQLIGED